MISLDEKLAAAKRKLGQANREYLALRDEQQKSCSHTWKVECRSPFEYSVETWRICTSCEVEMFVGFN